MSAPRFYVSAPLALGAVELPERVAHHATRVLRLRDGAPLVLFDGRGGEYRGYLQAGTQPSAVLTAHDAVERESPLAATLLQALVGSDKLDWIVEKATELGAAGVFVVPTARSVVRLDGERLARRVAHWQDVAIAACAQCGRNRLPRIAAYETPAAAIAALPDGPRHVLSPDAAIALGGASAACTVAIGPEGGFTAEELQQLERAQFAPARLGPRVLRTETAGVAALAVLQARAGDM
jgi:16S rRNA (uracil1498-N3)-methyltransferase